MIALFKNSLIKMIQFIVLSLVFLGTANAQSSPINSSSSFSAAQQTELQSMIHDYIVNNPEVLIEAGQKLRESQIAAMQAKAKETVTQYAPVLLNSKFSPVVGDADASINVIEFLDYQCGHCRTMGPILEKVIQNNPKVRFVFKELPLEKSSRYAAEVGIAAYMQDKFMPVHQALLATPLPLTDDKVNHAAKSAMLDMKTMKADLADSAVQSELKNNRMLADTLGIRGTPTFLVIHADKSSKGYVINDIAFIPGGINQKSLQEVIDKMNKAGA